MKSLDNIAGVQDLSEMEAEVIQGGWKLPKLPKLPKITISPSGICVKF
jgi:hypothetical protein